MMSMVQSLNSARIVCWMSASAAVRRTHTAHGTQRTVHSTLNTVAAYSIPSNCTVLHWFVISTDSRDTHTQYSILYTHVVHL